jgi:hypothetical protein
MYIYTSTHTHIFYIQYVSKKYLKYDIITFRVKVTTNTDKFILMRLILISLYVITEYRSYIATNSKHCGRVSSVANGLSVYESQ